MKFLYSDYNSLKLQCDLIDADLRSRILDELKIVLNSKSLDLCVLQLFVIIKITWSSKYKLFFSKQKLLKKTIRPTHFDCNNLKVQFYIKQLNDDCKDRLNDNNGSQLTQGQIKLRNCLNQINKSP